MIQKINIAIDGHSGCGKGTLAKYLAVSLGYNYIDSGAMYRAIAFYLLKNNLSIEQFIKNISKNSEFKVDFRYDEVFEFFNIYLNDELIQNKILSDEIAKKASDISKDKYINDFVVNLQKRITTNKGNVIFGRDMGNTVLPNAELKIYMITNPEIRAKRVYDELKETNNNLSYDKILKNIKENDLWDLTNAVSPLYKADDAIILDNTNMSKDEQARVALTWAKGVISAYK